MQTIQSTLSSLFSAYASLTGSIMLIRTMVNDIIPGPVNSYICSLISKRFNFKPKINKLTLIVEKKMGMVRNEIYDAAEIYLSNKFGPEVDKLKVGKSPKQKQINVSIEKNQQVSDKFRDIDLSWKIVSIESDRNKDKKYIELSFEKKFKDVVLNEYLPNVAAEVRELKEKKKVVKLYTKNCSFSDSDDDGPGREWGCITLNHPANFDTLALEPWLKNEIIEDLHKFVKRKEFYKRVGRAWKRGYLLHGPPGTGKSTLIAAMANYLKFDIFDVELSSLQSDYWLKRTLLSITNKSIIVIEDIDCNSQVKKRSGKTDGEEAKVTLSGILNFIDGLWSSSGDERIIIFTTNHIDKIDPALLRPGRMDMHIYMGYCGYESFKTLANNYLALSDDHKLFGEIKELIESVKVTPAEIAEELTRCQEDPDLALTSVVNLLKRKKFEPDEENIDGGNSMPQETAGEETEETNQECCA